MDEIGPHRPGNTHLSQEAHRLCNEVTSRSAYGLLAATIPDEARRTMMCESSPVRTSCAMLGQKAKTPHSGHRCQRVAHAITHGKESYRENGLNRYMAEQGDAMAMVRRLSRARKLAEAPNHAGKQSKGATSTPEAQNVLTTSQGYTLEVHKARRQSVEQQTQMRDNLAHAHGHAGPSTGYK